MVSNYFKKYLRNHENTGEWVSVKKFKRLIEEEVQQPYNYKGYNTKRGRTTDQEEIINHNPAKFWKLEEHLLDHHAYL